MSRLWIWLAVACLVSLLILPSGAGQPLLSPSLVAAQQRGAESTARGDADEPIDFERARELLRKKSRGVELTAEEQAYLSKAQAARRARAGQSQRPALVGETTGLVPLSDMSATDDYKGQDGGLYGEGRNSPPAAHRSAAEDAAAQIQPLNADGNPDANGRVVFVSISMSNATQEFSLFQRLAMQDTERKRQVMVVDCAQGGMAMAEWASPQAPPWEVAERRLAAAGVSPKQVQVAWIKLANKSPRGELDEHGKKLEKDTLAVIQNARQRFPNLRIAYLSSRIYAGYANGPLNPEPYAYESAYVVRWLIQNQICGDEALNYDPARGPVKAPLLLWGPYLWADGTSPRNSDQLVWNRDDLAGDGTHPSNSGRAKVAEMLLDFVRHDPTAKVWYRAD
jgi:hypothetical protein